MSADHQVLSVENFGDADELVTALNMLIEEAATNYDATYVSVESAGFALIGWAALVRMPDDIFTIELCDKEPSLGDRS